MKHFDKLLSATLLITSLFSVQGFSQTRMVVNGNYIVVSGGTSGTPNYMVVDNNATNAITRSSGHIVSEGEFNYVKWNVGASTGAYVVPFGYSTTSYLPLTVNITGAGTGPGYLITSTYTTPNTNLPFPSGVTELNNSSGNNALYVLDRWWAVDAAGYSTKPTASLTFTYRDPSEFSAPNTITESNLQAQRWNSGSSTWGDMPPVGTVNTGANFVTTTGITSADLYRHWVLVDNTSPLAPLCTPPTVNMSSDITVCNGSPTTVTATASGGSGAYSYSWSPSTGLSNTNISNPVATPGSTITYTCLVTDVPAACTNTGTVTVTVKNAPTAAAAGPDQTTFATCGLTSVTLAGNTPTSGTGSWSIVSGTGGSFISSTNPTTTFNGTTGTAYVLRWTISNAPCTASTDDVNITFNQNPTTSAAGPDQTGATTCGLTSVTLAANTPTAGSGTWTIISGAGGTFVDFTSPTSGFSGTAGVTYVLRWTISNTPCTSSTDDVTITFNQNPDALSGGSTTICENGSYMLAAGEASSSIGTILWTENGAGSITAGATTLSPTYTASAGDAGNTVTLTMTVSNAPCTNATATYSVIVKGIPTTANAGSDQTVCSSTATLSGNTAITGIGSWSVIYGTAGLITPTSPISGVTGLTPGTTDTLSWTIANAPCPASTDKMVINVPAFPTASAGGSQTICQNGTAVVSGASSSNGTILWTENGAGSITAGVTTLTPTYTAAAGDAGNTVTLTMTVSNAPCPNATATYSVTVKGLPTAANAGADQNLCSPPIATVAGNTPAVGTGVWSLISGTATIGNPSSPTTGISGLVIGSPATLRWTISNAPCAASTDDVLLTLNPTPTITVSGTNTICNGQSTTLTANGANSYLWSPTGSLNNSTIANPIASPSITTAYSVLGTSAAGCVGFTTYSVTVNPLPTANAGADASICVGSQTTLNGTGNGTYSWSPSYGLSSTSIANPIANPTVAMSYTLSVTNSCGTADDAMDVSMLVLPFANAGNNATVCVGVTTTLSGLGNGTFSWAPAAGMSCPTCATTSVTPSVSTTYTLSVTNSCGTATDPINLSAGPVVVIDSIHSVSACDASDGGVFITVSGGTPNYNYVWNPGPLFTQDVTGLSPGSYTVTVSDQMSCQVKVTQNIHVIPPPTPLEVCISTVDSVASAYVHIVWEKPITSLIDSFKIYREIATVFTKIATVPYAKETIFKDSIPGVDPKNQSHKYKISSIDNNNVEGPLSNAHETMWLKVTQPSPPAFDLTWTDYCGFPVTIYYIYRDSLHNGDYELIGSAYWGTNVFTDPTPPNDTARYRIESFIPSACTATGKYPDPQVTTVKGSKSNSDNKLGFVSVEDIAKGNWVNIFPNPNAGQFTVSSLGFMVNSLNIYDIYGQLVYETTVNVKQKIVNLDVPDGVYFVKVISQNATTVKKIVISR